MQKDIGKEQIEQNNYEKYITDYFVNIDKIPFKDTIPIIMSLDLVITVDTSIAHLAGSMGCKVWVVLQYIPDWRWMLDKKFTPWYPSMKLFRQSKPNDWGNPFKQIEKEIKSFINS